jgi:hypothetical protein
MRFQKSRRDTRDGERDERDVRRWGPFSGGQLTTIIVAVVIMALFPVGAWAVVNSNVAITDPGGVNRAKVDVKGNLNSAIHDAVSGTASKVDAKGNINTALHDAVSGTAAKVNAFGQVSAVVTGTVTAVPGLAANTFPSLQVDPGSSWATVIPSAQKFVVSSINVDTWQVTPGTNDAIQIGESTDGCATAIAVEAVNPGGIGITSIDLGSAGLTLAAGVSLCAINNDTTNLAAAVFALYHD